MLANAGIKHNTCHRHVNAVLLNHYSDLQHAPMINRLLSVKAALLKILQNVMLQYLGSIQMGVRRESSSND